MKIKININYDDWKLIESNVTGLPNMNDELLAGLANIASSDSFDVLLTISGKPEFKLTYDKTANKFKESIIEHL
ncbi:MAG: hypothetical protein EKK56_02230 [Flavobacteriaceae bacterium]|nr:MAG: hypothetical protein EKK56_02230 [Flavobacteriaceae bacterium]